MNKEEAKVVISLNGVSLDLGYTAMIAMAIENDNPELLEACIVLSPCSMNTFSTLEEVLKRGKVKSFGVLLQYGISSLFTPRFHLEAAIKSGIKSGSAEIIKMLVESSPIKFDLTNGIKLALELELTHIASYLESLGVATKTSLLGSITAGDRELFIKLSTIPSCYKGLTLSVLARKAMYACCYKSGNTGKVEREAENLSFRELMVQQLSKPEAKDILRLKKGFDQFDLFLSTLTDQKVRKRFLESRYSDNIYKVWE